MAFTTDEVRQMVHLSRGSFPRFATACLKILPKIGGQLEPLAFNRAQAYIHNRLERQRAEKGMVRALILKGRKQGASTYTGARFYHRTSLHAGMQAMVIAHKQSSTDYLYDMVERFHKNNPIATATEAANAKELKFAGINSGYSVATAGSADIGRGGTAQLLHASEHAFWKNAETHEAGIGNIVARVPSTEIIKESTANGIGNLFHQQWQLAESGAGDYIAIFVPWYWEPAYSADVPEGFELTKDEEEYRAAYKLTLGQMAWRRIQVQSYGHGFEWLFDQEFPACVVGDTRVGTARGMLKIKDARVGDEATLGTVSHSMEQPASEIFKLKTSMGYQLRGTWDHPIFSAGGILVPMRFCDGLDVQLQAPRLADAYHVERWRELGIDSQITVTEDFGRFLGLFMGDGSLYEGCVSIACDARDTDLISECRRLLLGVFGLEAHQRLLGTKKGCAELRVQRKEITALFDRLGMLREGTSGRKRKVCVPECIWRSPRSVVKEFLSGLFEADGFNGYGHPRVTLFSKYDDFLRDVQLLLLAFGITSRIATETSRKREKEHVGYSLSLRRNESSLFNTEIGFLSQRKRDKVASWKAVGNSGRTRNEVALLDRVVSVVADGHETTYDLTIDGEHAFDANGLLTHNTAALAFQSSTGDPYISPLLVSAGMNSGFYDEVGPLIVGVDPADGGADRTAIVFRRGRVVLEVRTYQGKDTMQVAGIIAKIISEYRPDAVFLDKIGIGAGIYSRLRELQHGNVYGVVSGARATEPEIYADKRAECWARMKKWLEDYPVRLPDEPALAADLSAPGYDHDSAGKRLRLESKKDMKKRGIRSPDLGDALSFTFADHIGIEGEGDYRGGSAGHVPASRAGY